MTFMYVGCAHSAWTGAPAREFYLLRSDSIVPWRQQTTGCSRSVGQITLEESDKLTRGSDSDDRRS
jgi:hypothetical protein